MTRKLLTALCTALALGWAGVASAAIPKLMNFQGRLADASGTPKTGSFTMTFSLWNAASAGTACFTETQTVAANSGLVNVNIGSVASLTTCDFSVPYWLQIQVGTDSAMSPRITLTAAAYAMRAEVADNAGKLNSLAQGAAAGQIPSNSGVVQTSLNADLLDGSHSTAFAPSGTCAVPYSCVGHTHTGPNVYSCPKIQDSGCGTNCLGALSMSATCTYLSMSGDNCFQNNSAACTFVGRLMNP